MEWEKIKAEYIAGGTSYRKLAEKHGVPFSTLKRVAVKENWTELREKAREKADTVLANSVGKKNGKKRIKILDVADKLLERMSDMLERPSIMTPQNLKYFTSALKDLKEIKGEMSAMDKREQKARLAKLEKDIEANTQQQTITVTIQGDAEDYSV